MSRCGLRVPVAAVLPLTADVPSLFEALSFSSPKALLESARTHPVTGRYSLLVGEPSLGLIARTDEVELKTQTRAQVLRREPFSILQELLEARRAARLDGFPPFVGGAVGYFSYDAARMIEPLPSLAVDDLNLPLLEFLFCDEAVVVDHLEEKVWVIALADPSGDSNRAYDQAVGRVERLVRRLTRVPVRPEFVEERTFMVSLSNHERSFHSTHTRAEFEAMVRKVKEFIAAGEIYQANLSQRFALPLQEDPWLLYRRLTQINPSPFALFADFGSLQIVSASPERFLRVAGRQAETRPIAGTRPRDGP